VQSPEEPGREPGRARKAIQKSLEEPGREPGRARKGTFQQVVCTTHLRGADLRRGVLPA